MIYIVHIVVLIMFFDELLYYFRYDIKSHKTLKYEDQIISLSEAIDLRKKYRNKNYILYYFFI